MLPGEQILWSGQPAGGLLLTSQDIFLVPFSIAWFSIALTSTGIASSGVRPFPFGLFGLLFVTVGLYLVLGRFALDLWCRKHTSYAVTNRRVLIARSGSFGSFTALDLQRLPEIALRERSDGRGTIVFGTPAGFASTGANWTFGVPSLDPTPQFLVIPGATAVFQLIQQQSRAAA